MREEVIKPRLIKREDADLLKLNFPKMRCAAGSINGQAPAYLADEVRAIRNRGHYFNRRCSLVPGEIIKGAPSSNDEHQTETVREPFAAVEVFCGPIRIDRVGAACGIGVVSTSQDDIGHRSVQVLVML